MRNVPLLSTLLLCGCANVHEIPDQPIICIDVDALHPDYADCILRGTAGRGFFMMRFGSAITVNGNVYRLRGKP